MRDGRRYSLAAGYGLLTCQAIHGAMDKLKSHLVQNLLTRLVFLNDFHGLVSVRPVSISGRALVGIDRIAHRA